MPVEPVKTVFFKNGQSFSVVVNDLLFEPVDCIVNAANGGLAHGGGVALAISTAAGPALDEDGRQYIKNHGHIAVGESVVTTAGNLPFKGVIHAVGPRLGDGNEGPLLEKAVTSAFMRAHERNWSSLAFPAISSGIFAVPISVCASAYVRAVSNFFRENQHSPLKTIRLTLFLGPMVEAVKKEIELLSRKDF